MHSLVERMCLEAGNDLWRGRTLAGALGFSVVITGRTRPRENGRRRKKARRRIKKKVSFFFVTPIGKSVKSACWNSRNPLKNVCFGRDVQNSNFTMRVFKKRENPLVFKGFLVKSHLKMKTCFYEVRHNPKSEQLGSGFVVCDSVSGPIYVYTKLLVYRA